MNKMSTAKKRLLLPCIMLVLFVIYTIAVKLVDVQAIGPNGSSVGFATLNGKIHELTGVHFWLYELTDYLGLVAIGMCLGFGALGLIQWIKRKSLWRVDGDILVLGVYYIAVIALYLLFEFVTINYRPVLIEGVLETSYPSSTTLLVLCVVPTAMFQLCSRIHQKPLRIGVAAIGAVFTAFMVIGRLICGVHWLTDIVGGIILGFAMIMFYVAAVLLVREKAAAKAEQES